MSDHDNLVKRKGGCYTWERLSVRAFYVHFNWLECFQGGFMADTGEKQNAENQRLSREEEFKIDQRIRIGVIIGAVLILAYLAYCAVKKIEIGIAYYVIVGVFIALYWLFMDVISLKLKHGFAGRSQSQKAAYYKMAVIDLIGVIGLGLFLMGGVGADSSSGTGGGSGNTSLIGAVIYLICFMTARRLRQQYERTPGEEEGSAEQKKEENAEKGKADEKGASSAVLPTAADRQQRQLTAAEKIVELNRQAQDAQEPEDIDSLQDADAENQKRDDS